MLSGPRWFFYWHILERRCNAVTLPSVIGVRCIIFPPFLFFFFFFLEEVQYLNTSVSNFVSLSSWPAERLDTSRTQFCQHWTESPPWTSPRKRWAPWAQSCWRRPRKSSSSRQPQVPGSDSLVIQLHWQSPVSTTRLWRCLIGAACFICAGYENELLIQQIRWKMLSLQSWPTRQQISTATPSSSVSTKTPFPRYVKNPHG